MDKAEPRWHEDAAVDNTQPREPEAAAVDKAKAQVGWRKKISREEAKAPFIRLTNKP